MEIRRLIGINVFSISLRFHFAIKATLIMNRRSIFTNSTIVLQPLIMTPPKRLIPLLKIKEKKLISDTS